MTKRGKRRIVIFLCAAAVILVAAGIVRVKLHPRPVRSMSRSQIICTIPAQTQSWNTSLRNMAMNLLRQSTEVFNLHDFRGCM